MKILFFIVGTLLPCALAAQTFTGSVSNRDKEPLFGATVYWVNTKNYVTTDDNGSFSIQTSDANTKLLVASASGYLSDTVLIGEKTNIKFRLKSSLSLAEVVVRGQQDGVILDDLSPYKTERITQTELKKAACCDLAGCFETQITVQPQTTNVITNSKELRILGLAGAYTQILIDGLPLIQGLTYTYGISSIPGTLVDNIYISKGGNSILQGFEGISGQINVVTKDPSNTDKLLLNAYINSFGEKHLNANVGFKKGKWSNLTTLHSVQPANRVDRNDDNFLDLPLLTRYMVANNLKYGDDKKWGWNARLGVKYLNEERVGGQVNYTAQADQGSGKTYGQTINISQPEVWMKAGYRLNGNKNISLYASAIHQNQNSYFGLAKYDAKQSSIYTNLQYELAYGSNSNVKTGISYRHLDLNENIRFTENTLERTYAGNYQKKEDIVGVFAENSMSFFKGRLTWVAGIRADHHNQFGVMLTPRTLLKYDLSPSTIIRANIGTGWRTVNFFSENIGLLASSRNIIFTEQLQPEKALNYGINITKKFKGDLLSGFISGDYYRTTFQNQIFPDYDADPTQAIIKNFTGTSVSETFQAEMLVAIGKRFETKFGYTLLDVYRQVNGEKVILPFNPKYKVVTTFSYKPLSKKFHFDANFHVFGKQRLPNTASNPTEFQRPDYSKPYTVLNAQFTYKFGKFEVYTGCENIFNFIQEKPILSYNNPFGEYFDTSSVWGPTRGRELYIGFRYTIPKS